MCHSFCIQLINVPYKSAFLLILSKLMVTQIIHCSNKALQTRCEITIHQVEIPFQKWYDIPENQFWFTEVAINWTIWEVNQYFNVRNSEPIYPNFDLLDEGRNDRQHTAPFMQMFPSTFYAASSDFPTTLLFWRCPEIKTSGFLSQTCQMCELHEQCFTVLFSQISLCHEFFHKSATVIKKDGKWN